MSQSWVYGASPATAAPRLAAPVRMDAIDILERCAAVLILMMMSAALLGRIGDPEQTGNGAGWLRQMWFPVYGVIGLMMASRAPRMTSVWAAGLLISTVVIWAFASTSWSLLPDVTFRRAVALAFASLFGLYLAARYDWRELIELLAATAMILAIGSVIAAVAVPSFGVHHDELFPGAWRGLWFEKNALGGNMARGLLACLCAAMMSPVRRTLWLGGAAVCMVLVVMSTSTTALLASLLVFAGITGMAMVRRGPIWAVATIWLAALAGLAFVGILVLAPDLFFHAIGKDPTLTGRTGLWEALLRQSAIRPLTGYGYGAFWQDKYGPVSWVRNEIDWPANNADNGWMDLLIQMGWVGASLVGLCLGVFALRAIMRLWRGPEAYWAILFLLLLGLVSISESVLARPNDMTWVVFVAGLGKLMQPSRPRSDPAPG